MHQPIGFHAESKRSPVANTRYDTTRHATTRFYASLAFRTGCGDLKRQTSRFVTREPATIDDCGKADA